MSYRKFVPFPVRRTHIAPAMRAAGIVLVVVAAACSEHPTAADRGSVVDAVAVQRLFVADASQPSARLIALADNSTITTFTLAKPASAVYASPSRRFAVAHESSANTVEFFDGGAWISGAGSQALAHRAAPGRLNFALSDGTPGHENVVGNWISVFFDGSGMARWVDERDLVAGNYRAAVQLSSGGPHHSASATLLTATGEYFTYGALNPAGGNPKSVVVADRQGREIARNDNCPSMHGTRSTKDAVLYGCSDGAILVRAGTGTGATPTLTKLTPTGDLAGLGVRSAWGEHDSPFFVARLSTPSGVTPSRRVLATVDPQTGAMSALPLPAGTVEHAVAVDVHTRRIVVLATTGTLYIFDGATRSLLSTIASVVPPLPSSGAKAHDVAVAENVAFVASPTTGEVLKVDTQRGTIGDRIRVSGEPSRITVLGAARSGTYRLASGT